MKEIEFSPKNIIFALFIAIESFIFIAFNILSFNAPYDPIYLKYAGVLICVAVTAAMLIFFDKKRDVILLTAALVFTAVSDLFILVLDDYYEVGVLTFIIAQSFHLIRLYDGRFKKIWITLTVRAALFVAVLIIFIATKTLNLLIAECDLYFVMLVCNAVDAWLLSGRGVKNILYAVGLTLFVGCDICVGLYQAGTNLGIINLTQSSIDVIQPLIWIFYLPSQVFIVNSVKDGKLYTLPKKLAQKQAEAGDIENETQN